MIAQKDKYEWHTHKIYTKQSKCIKHRNNHRQHTWDFWQTHEVPWKSKIQIVKIL